MASKKEHKRKQHAKSDSVDAASAAVPPRRIGLELNSLDLLALYGTSRAAAASPQANATAEPPAKEATNAAEPEEAARRESATAGRGGGEEAGWLLEAEERQRHMAAAVQASHAAEKELRIRQEVEAAERARQARQAERERIVAEEEDFRRRQAEAEAMAKRAAEEAERAETARRLAQEAEDKARREAEEAERARLAEIARQKAEEEERQRREVEAVEKARREAEEAERARLAEIARQKAEEEDFKGRQAEAEAMAKRAAEEAERAETARRLAQEIEDKRRREAEAAEAELAREQAEHERRRKAEAMESSRRQTEVARLDAEAERQFRQIEAEFNKTPASYTSQDEDAAVERAQNLSRKKALLQGANDAQARQHASEAADKVRRLVRKLRSEQERNLELEVNADPKVGPMEKPELETSSVKPAELPQSPFPQAKTGTKTMETVASERARKMAEDVEHARMMAEKVEQARLEAEEAEKRHRALMEEERLYKEKAAAGRALQMAAETEQVRKMAASVDQARRLNDGLPAAPLEFENPYWQRQPEIFDSLSGAPRGQIAASPSYAKPATEETLPVTLAAGGGGMPERSFVQTGGNFTHSHHTAIRSKAEEQREDLLPPEKRMYIVMVTSEVAPCAKVGGLGDVILGLGRELMKRGHSVEVICPMYSCMRYDQIEDLHEEYNELWCPHYGEWRPEKVFQGKVGGMLPVNFITCGKYTERENIYGYEDDLQRFTYFSRAAMEFMYKTNRRPEIIHCHDWAVGLVPAILWDIYEKLGWNNSRCVYTIHNNECQGMCGWPDKLLSMVGLDAKTYMRPDRMQDDSHKNCLNMMKGGIVYSNFVTTVSPTYATELKTVAGGHGLQTTFVKNSAKLGGILNGIDYDTWNPMTDAKISARYSGGDDFYEKYKNKTALREWLGLWDAWRPIISVVTRLTAQKGLDLIKQAIFTSIKSEAQFVLLGSAPDPKINNEFLRLQNELKDNHDVNLYIGYHEDLSRLIYAGSDMFLVPSLYEPCGLTQMISLRYGTVPIVRETGGLVDTVFDLDNSGKGLSEANGFTFRDPSTISLNYGLTRAIRLWYENPEAFNRLARNGMRYDYSWRNPAVHYENIYNYIRA